jgi:hypothetical protein
VLRILVAVLLTGGVCIASPWPFLYVGKIENAFRQEAFPGQQSAGYRKLIRVHQGNHLGARSIRRAARRCLRSDYQDRWGNYPVIVGALEFLDDTDDDINALAAVIRKHADQPRLRRQAEVALLSRLANLSEQAARNARRPGCYPEERQRERLAGFSRSLGDIVRPLASGDSIAARGLALKVLAGMQHPDAVELAAEAMDASPKRLRNDAYHAAWTYAAIRGEIPNPVLEGILVAAVKSADDDLRLRILQDFHDAPKLHLNEAQTLELLWNPTLFSFGLVRLYKLDAARAIDQAFTWVANADPVRHWGAAGFLRYQVKGLPAARVLELCESPVLSVRFSALEIARCQRQELHDARADQEYQRVSERLRQDPDPRLAVMARWYAGDRSAWPEAPKAVEEIYQECFNSRRSQHRPPPTNVTPEQAAKQREEWLAVQQEVIAQARTLFPLPAVASADPVRGELYSLLLEKYSRSMEKSPAVVCVPEREDKASLYGSAAVLPVLTKEELQTLREDYAYAGAVLSLSEIFYDAARQEAWVEVSWGGSGQGVICRKKDGRWVIESETFLWIS